METLRLLLNETENEIKIDGYRGSKDGFMLWQQFSDPLYYQRTLKDRVTVAIELALGGNGPEVLRLSLAQGPLPSLAHAMTNSYGEFLSNAVVRSMGDYMIYYRIWDASSITKVYPVTGMNLEQATPKA